MAGSARVMSVDLDVPACEVAGPEDGAAVTGGEVETDGDARGGEQGAQVVTVLHPLAGRREGRRPSRPVGADRSASTPGHSDAE